MRELHRILEKKDRLAIGLMSGTSADGIDAALVEIHGCGPDTRVVTRAYHEFPLEEKLRTRVLASGDARVAEIAGLNYALGEAFAAASLALLEKASVDPRAVDFIASHGQTVHHNPEGNGSERSTLQIGEGAVIAERTGRPVVCDFRARDVAAGGTGAPLVPLVDHMLFADPARTRMLVNLGGIVNISLIPPGAKVDDVIAFDVGPCNMLIDAMAEVLISARYDAGGEIACSGRPSNKLIEEILRHPYYAVRPPKSTGRELFGERFAASVLSSSRRLGLTERDTLASVTLLVGRSIQRALTALVSPGVRTPDEVIVSGGGVNNRAVMAGLEKAFPDVPVVTSREYGIDPNAKEAIAFAILGNETLEGRPGNVPGATGARSRVVLGTVVPGRLEEPTG